MRSVAEDKCRLGKQFLIAHCLERALVPTSRKSVPQRCIRKRDDDVDVVQHRPAVLTFIARDDPLEHRALLAFGSCTISTQTREFSEYFTLRTRPCQFLRIRSY